MSTQDVFFYTKNIQDTPLNTLIIDYMNILMKVKILLELQSNVHLDGCCGVQIVLVIGWLTAY